MWQPEANQSAVCVQTWRGSEGTGLREVVGQGCWLEKTIRKDAVRAEFRRLKKKWSGRKEHSS